MKNTDAATGSILILVGVLVAYITIRGLWSLVILSLVYPWDVELKSGVSAPSSSTPPFSIKTTNVAPGNPVPSYKTNTGKVIQFPSLPINPAIAKGQLPQTTTSTAAPTGFRLPSINIPKPAEWLSLVGAGAGAIWTAISGIVENPPPILP